MNQLLKTSYPMVILDHSLVRPDGVKLLEYLANHPSLQEAEVLYCLDKKVAAALPTRLVSELGVSSLIYHPIDVEELCFQMARLLGRPAPVADLRLRRESRSTRGDAEAVLMACIGLEEELIHDLIPRATARRLRTVVSDDWRELAESWDEDPPRLLLVNLARPRQSERLELFQAVKAYDTRILALVSEVLQERVEASNRGAHRVLPAPLSVEAVMDAIHDVLEADREEQLKILIVDDDALTLANLQWLLTQTGYRVQTLSKPLLFWDTLETFVPDLVILDVLMPEVSGIELCRAVRTDLRWRDLPLLFLTIQSDAVTSHKLFQAGADDFLTKPVVSIEVLTRVTNRLSRARTARSADRDSLTGLLTRRRAVPTLRRLLRMAERRELTFSLCIVDLDHFKQVNDRHGHPAGDQVLATLGKLLRRTFRNEDVLARWGGEEFVVGLYGMPSETAKRRLLDCLDRLSKWLFEGSEPFSVTFSAGIAEYSQDGNDVQALYAAADEALYQAKEKGRNQVLTTSRSCPVPTHPSRVDVVLAGRSGSLAQQLADALHELGYSFLCLDRASAQARLTVHPPEIEARLIILDQEQTGSLLQDLHIDRRQDARQVLVLTTESDEPTKVKILDWGAHDCLDSGSGLPLLMRKIERALQTHRLIQSARVPTTA